MSESRFRASIRKQNSDKHEYMYFVNKRLGIEVLVGLKV